MSTTKPKFISEMQNIKPSQNTKESFTYKQPVVKTSHPEGLATISRLKAHRTARTKPGGLVNEQRTHTDKMKGKA